jgi:lysylphosphatidylglycerol synthetase-like protein (DUF2156 family)
MELWITEEAQVRKHFNAEYGGHLPEDICLCIGNEPTRWDVSPFSGDVRETLPEIAPDLIVEVRSMINTLLAVSLHLGANVIFRSRLENGLEAILILLLGLRVYSLSVGCQLALLHI